jgi:hypothetical protein
MTDPTRQLLAEEAIRALKSYLLSGLDGFRQKGIDRVKALGIDLDHFEGVERLIGFLYVRLLP